MRKLPLCRRAKQGEVSVELPLILTLFASTNPLLAFIHTFKLAVVGVAVIRALI